MQEHHYEQGYTVQLGGFHNETGYEVGPHERSKLFIRTWIPGNLEGHARALSVKNTVIKAKCSNIINKANDSSLNI